jgi:hypothetical protein
MPGKRRVPHTRTPEDRDFDMLSTELRVGRWVSKATGRRVLRHDVTLPFGYAVYFSELSDDDDPLVVELGSTGVYVPRTVYVEFSRDQDAVVRLMRIEVREGIPGCVELIFRAGPYGRSLRPADLAGIDLDGWVEDVLCECTWHIGADGGWVSRPGTVEGRTAIHAAAQPTVRRSITPELLREVADIYRANIDGKPIEAVCSALGLEYRTAARYVELCRKDEFGLLPKTQKGKRKA